MPEARLELAPLIDVVFLLLTFFVVAMTVLVQDDQVRAGSAQADVSEALQDRTSPGPSDDDVDGARARLFRLLDLRFQEVLGEQTAVQDAGRLHILTIDAQGGLQLDGAGVEAAGLEDRLGALQAEPADRILYVALADEAESDRGPVLFDVLQRAAGAGWRATLVEPIESQP
ncbi:MAG: biopolymer transporter ExbD [Planctomycetota bacterium]